jgi:small subunit ribosomal protein S16
VRGFGVWPFRRNKSTKIDFFLTFSRLFFSCKFRRKIALVKLRLQRTGTKGNPHYRIVAADSRFPRDGRFIEIVGQYHPIDKKNQVIVNSEKAVSWLQKGAQPTNTVLNILKKSGVWEQYTSAKSKPKA